MYEVPTDEEIVLLGFAARLAEVRDISRAVVSDARGAVRDASRAGLSDRLIARTLGVHRRTVKAWKTTPAKDTPATEK